MPRYKYEKLSVAGDNPRDFHPGSLRPAVEYLRSIHAESVNPRIVAKVSVKAGTFKVNAPASVTLEQITGKTAKQVWEILDMQIDEQITYFERRSKLG